MPVPLVNQVFHDGIRSVPLLVPALKALAVIVVIYYAKSYFQGAENRSERNMHGKVILVTGGTSGIGAKVVKELATRGAQIVLLTQDPIGDPFLVEYIEDIRSETGNELITAEQVDLASLHSIRTFATKWIDNAPPRRLDMIILCANTLTPRGGKLESTDDGVEINWAVNYLANFHLLSILSPALRAQPPDRDVRVIIGTCISYLGGELPVQSNAKGEKDKPVQPSKSDLAAAFSPATAYASSKLALMTFAHAFQKHLSSYTRPDKQPTNTRVILVDPGFSRTPGMRRYLSWGSLIGLALYLIMYPIWWLILKSPDMGAQTFLYAAMEANYGRGEGGWLLKECREIKLERADINDETAQKALWQYSESMIQEAEKRGAKARAENKKNEKAQAPVSAEKKRPSQEATTTKQRNTKGSRKTG
ncbi:oxidoreductase [Myriangium duriaei CBS 260.36]|uniref:Oxidoreductase n=1 Tax=Myriangium duriaei CBS 260.36 TaxID=1168546 RepID=A0A9P4J0R7_9PEZI|nr:oxidoreductase [Myriangium duriaei CBS 260.36]